MPLAHDCLEAVCVALCRLGGLALRARIYAVGDEPSRLVALLARSAERCVGIRAEREEFLFSLETILEAPPLTTARRDEQE